MANSVDYKSLIVRSLKGETEELSGIPSDRLDWNGVSTVLAIYDAAANEERSAVIEALGRIIDDDSLEPHVLAEIVDLTASLGISQVEANVRRLGEKPVAAEPMVREAVTNYLAFRQLAQWARNPPAGLVSARQAGD